MMPSDIKQLLRKIALFSELPGSEIESLSHLVRVKDVARNEIIVQLGEQLQGFFVVISGSVTISLVSPKGDGRIIEIIHSGHSFGEALMFLEKTSPVQAMATEAGKVMFVPGKEVLALVANEQKFVQAMLAGLSIRLHRLVTDIQSCSLHRAHQRVIGYLLGELDALGKKGDQPVIHLPVSKKMVASRLDLTAETFSRVLHELADQGVIQVKGKTIDILSVENLRHYMSIPV